MARVESPCSLWDSSWCPQQRFTSANPEKERKTKLTWVKWAVVIPLTCCIFKGSTSTVWPSFSLRLKKYLCAFYLLILWLVTCLHIFLKPLHPGIGEKQTSRCVSSERWRKAQLEQSSASACERTSPHHLIHHMTARTTAMTTCSMANTVALVTCSLATAIAHSNRQVTWAGHTLTALTLQHPHLLLLPL